MPRSSFTLMKKIPLLLLSLSSSLFFVACNGGSSGDSDLIRPASMDGVVLTTPSGVTFEFVRSFTSGSAEENGGVETGAFFYNFAGANIQLFPSLTGDNSDVIFPDSVNLATYQYLAVNETSGILTLNGQGVSDLNVTGTFRALNNSVVFFFTQDSLGVPSNEVVIDISFQGPANNFLGGQITDITTTWSVGGSTAPQVDTVIIDSTLSLATGGPVPAGFNPDIDLDRASRVVPPTFSDQVFVLTDTNGAVPTVQLQFTADAGNGTFENVNETGQALQRVGGGVTQPGINYIAERIERTSTVNVTLGGGNNAQDGFYTFDFESLDSGVVTQLTGSGALLQGRFQVFDSNVF